MFEAADIIEEFCVSLGEREADALKTQLGPILQISSGSAWYQWTS